MRPAVVLLAALLPTVACGGGGDTTQQAAPAAAPTDTADGPGVITGTITFEGQPPAPRPLQMDSDPKCTPLPGAVSERLVVGEGGGLQNAFVWVKDGLGDRTFTAPASIDEEEPA